MMWLTADTHFGHKRIGELAGRLHVDVHEGDALLKARWVERVHAGDEVYILGDLAMGDFRQSLELVASLPGRKRLIPGNHDRVHPVYKGSPAKRSEWRTAYEEAGLEVLALEAELDLGGGLIVRASHFPYEGDHSEHDRHVDWRPVDDGRWLVHGHVHELWKVKDRMVNVGVDVWDYAPVSFDEVRSLIIEEEERKA